MICIEEEEIQPAGVAGTARCICLLGAGRSTGNLGVNALAAGTVTALLASETACELGWLDYGRELAPLEVRAFGRSIAVPGIAIRFSRRLWQANHIARLVATAWLARWLPRRARAAVLGGNPWLGALAQFDLAAAISGGDSFSDLYGLQRFFYTALPILLMLGLDVPVMLLPQTIGPFRSGIARWVARFILRRAQCIYGRDRQSVEWARKQLAPQQEARAAFCADVAFVLETRRPSVCEALLEEMVDSPRPVVGFNISGLLYGSGTRGAQSFGLAADYHRLVRELIEYFVREEDALVVLVPHVRGQEEDDLAAALDVLQTLDGDVREQVRVLDQPLDECEMKYMIGRMDFFLGSRMHACIAALSQAVPAAGLAYSDKFAGVFAAAGAEELALDLRHATSATVLEGVRQAFHGRSAWHARLAQRIPQLREQVCALFMQLPEAIEAPPQRMKRVEQYVPKHITEAAAR